MNQCLVIGENSLFLTNLIMKDVTTIHEKTLLKISIPIGFDKKPFGANLFLYYQHLCFPLSANFFFN